jgi:hypothetical protein
MQRADFIDAMVDRAKALDRITKGYTAMTTAMFDKRRPGPAPGTPAHVLVAGRMDNLGSNADYSSLYDNVQTGYREYWHLGKFVGHRHKDHCDGLLTPFGDFPPPPYQRDIKE